MALFLFFLTDKYLFFLGINTLTKADFFPCTWFLSTLTVPPSPLFPSSCFLTNPHQLIAFMIVR